MNPGCFAAASVFAHDSDVCRACRVFSDCATQSVATLEQIKGLVNVNDLLKRHEAARKALGRTPKPKLAVPEGWTRTEDGRVSPPPGFVAEAQAENSIEKPVERKTNVDRVLFAITYDQEEILSTLSVNSEKQARRLCSVNMIEQIKSELQAGRNALSQSKPQYIAVAIECLLSGGFSKSSLRDLYIERFSWGETTASSHVSIICPILTAFGIAKEINGCHVTSPALSA